MATVEHVDANGEPLSDDALLDEYISLTAQKRALDDEKNKLNKRIDAIERTITAKWGDSGTTKVTREVDGVGKYTVYLSRGISAKAKDGDTMAVVDALRRARFGELLGINHPKLKSWLKERLYNKHTDEWELNLDKLPPSFVEVMEVTEYFDLNCRKGQ